jgi:hypothetical protein
MVRHLVSTLALATSLLSGGALGAEPEEADHGVALGVGFASAYVFRGLNLLQESSQHDQHAVLQPYLSYDIPATGLTLGYFSSYQVAGKNRGDLVDAGSGHEQDVSLSWSRALGDFEIGTGVSAYLYPFADPEVAGTRTPAYLEPSLSASWSGALDLGLSVALMGGLQDVVRDYSYVYLSPTVGRSFELAEDASLDLSAGYGFKIKHEDDNVHDVSADVALSLAPAPWLEVTPGLHWSWTNLAGLAFVDEQVVWGSMTAGARL